MKNKSVQVNLVLLITAVIWGGGFVAQRLGMQQLSKAWSQFSPCSGGG